ncbi:MAG: hypothetical protein KKH28_09185 [Elusimicrobia bacterium]|nr:hypothetical protein [Elusimicrobiota bacterium]
MTNYFILLHDRTLGPVTAAEAVGLRGFTLETAVKYSDSASAGWIAAGEAPELVSAFNRLYPDNPADKSESSSNEAKALGELGDKVQVLFSEASSKISEISREEENLKDSFAVLRGSREREKDRLPAKWKDVADSIKATLAMLKSSEEEIRDLVREHRVRFHEARLMEEQGAPRLKEPRKLAEEYKRELENNLERAFVELNRLGDVRMKAWETDMRGRLEGEISAEKEKHAQSLAAWTKGFHKLLKKATYAGRGALNHEVRKFRETLARDLNATALEAGKALKAESADLRGKLARETEKFSAAREALTRELNAAAKAESADLRGKLALEAEKFSAAGESLIRELNAAALEAGKALEDKGVKVREELSLMMGKFPAVVDGLIWESREKTWTELEKKLKSEIPGVYAGIRAALKKEAADKIKIYTDMAAAELEAGRCAVLAELQPRWEKLSSAMAAEFNESLRDFKRRKEEDFSKVLSEQAAELEFLSRETRAKMEGVSSEFLGRIAEMKAWLEQTAGELAKTREAVDAAGAKGSQADELLGERIMELERKITKEMLNRKEGTVRSEIPVIIGTQKGAQGGKSPAPGAVPLYRERYSLKDNFTLAAALIAALLSILALLAK